VRKDDDQAGCPDRIAGNPVRSLASDIGSLWSEDDANRRAGILQPDKLRDAGEALRIDRIQTRAKSRKLGRRFDLKLNGFYCPTVFAAASAINFRRRAAVPS
jgi:hypothetical protein